MQGVGTNEILDYMTKQISSCRHILLIDPANQSPDDAAKMAMIASEAGTSAIFVGGSTNTSDNIVHDTVIAIKEGLELVAFAASQNPSTEDSEIIPIILFPNGSNALSPAADAITFMMLMNSRQRRYLIEEQLTGSSFINDSEIEPLPTGYLVFSPGGKVGEVGDAELIEEGQEELVKSYSLTASMYGFKLLYLEAGSGADRPISPQLVNAAKHENLTIIVGGGIRTPEQAKTAMEAGADWIVTGTIAEEANNSEQLQNTLKMIIEAISN